MEMYNSFLNMLNASGKEDVKFAFSLLESLDFEKDAAVILLLYKHTHKSGVKWTDLMKERVHSYLKSNKPTFANILTILKKKKADDHSLSIFREIFQQTLLSHCKEVGFDFVKEIRVEI